MIRIPLPCGKYITRSVNPLEDELETIQKCKAERDKIAIPIWGEERWRQILTVPARSVSRPRKDPTTPYNGVQHQERPGRANRYTTTWYEVEHHPGTLIESQTHGKRLPRKKRSADFSYGTDKAMFADKEQAKEAAIALAKEKQSEVYVVIHGGDDEPSIMTLKTL
ncbi:hypothetical protein [Halomonas sp. KO116]|uniref:hypothetical protein n=1 Tax=Halomonas sp. KO116 TaxID=1504981 RepID=UPI00118642AC|nr:hypothetical protein [Halomonas sp. KO116]